MLSAEDYKRAFLEVRAEMTDKHLEMLRAHYAAPHHSITMSELARAVGYANHSSANLRYGTFAHAMAGRLCFVKDRSGGQSQYLDALATPATDQDPNPSVPM